MKLTTQNGNIVLIAESMEEAVQLIHLANNTTHTIVPLPIPVPRKPYKRRKPTTKRTCPICGGSYGNLGNHILYKHKIRRPGLDKGIAATV